MKKRTVSIVIVFLIIIMSACKSKVQESDTKIIYLHHSTGGIIWKGYSPSFILKAVGKISPRLADYLSPKAMLPSLFEEYCMNNKKSYSIEELTFPKSSPYGWNNFPFDYYNIWVKHAGDEPFMEEPTLELLTQEYQVIIFKHCFPVSNIKPDQDSVDINSDYKTIGNYKLQYLALKEKLQAFPETKFILFTGAVQVKSNISEEDAIRAKEFFTWVRNEWDLPDDNVFLWDLYSLQTEGWLYFKDEFAASSVDSHPNSDFAGRVAKLLFNRIIDVIENDGDGTELTGEAI